MVQHCRQLRSGRQAFVDERAATGRWLVDGLLLRLAQPRDRCARLWRRWQRLPPGDRPGMLARHGVVRHATESAPQFDSGRKLASLVEGGADCGGVLITDNEHAGRMAAAGAVGKPRWCTKILGEGDVA